MQDLTVGVLWVVTPCGDVVEYEYFVGQSRVIRRNLNVAKCHEEHWPSEIT